MLYMPRNGSNVHILILISWEYHNAQIVLYKSLDASETRTRYIVILIEIIGRSI